MKNKIKNITNLLDGIFIILLVAVSVVGLLEFIHTFYEGIISGKFEYLSLLGALLIVLIGLEFVKIMITSERERSLYIAAVLDIVLIALSRKLILLKSETMMDIYEGIVIGFLMLVIVVVLKYLPRSFSLSPKYTDHVFVEMHNKVGALNSITSLFAKLNINIESSSVTPSSEKDGTSVFEARIDRSKSKISNKELEKLLEDLECVIQAKVTTHR